MKKTLTVPAKGKGKFDDRMKTGIGTYAPLKKGKGPPKQKLKGRSGGMGKKGKGSY